MENCATARRMDPSDIYDGTNQNELYLDYILNTDPFQRLSLSHTSDFGHGFLEQNPNRPKKEHDTLILSLDSLKERDLEVFNHLLENIARNTWYDHMQLNFQDQGVLKNSQQRVFHEELGSYMIGENSMNYSHKIRILRYHLGLDKLARG